MDRETGENSPDQETGEMPATARINLETGEMEINCNCPTRSHFRIPKEESQTKHEYWVAKGRQNYLTKKQTDMSPALLLLIPVFFMPAVGIVISILEILIHMWAHKKNKKLQNTNRFYQSPFHIFVCEFCHLCIDENSKNKITKLQDKRNNKFTKYGIECVRRVVT